MKAGTFNIHDYLGKLYENVEDKDLTLNEEEESGLSDKDGIIIPEEGKKAYDWLKREFQKGKSEVKVEMSSHTFKPGYEFEKAPQSTKDFPGMYSNSSKNGIKAETIPFPETKFPGSETKSTSNDKIEKNESSDGDEDSKKSSIKVEAKTNKAKTKEQPEDSKEKDKKEE